MGGIKIDKYTIMAMQSARQAGTSGNDLNSDIRDYLNLAKEISGKQKLAVVCNTPADTGSKLRMLGLTPNDYTVFDGKASFNPDDYCLVVTTDERLGDFPIINNNGSLGNDLLTQLDLATSNK